MMSGLAGIGTCWCGIRHVALAGNLLYAWAVITASVTMRPAGADVAAPMRMRPAPEAAAADAMTGSAPIRLHSGLVLAAPSRPPTPRQPTPGGQPGGEIPDAAGKGGEHGHYRAGRQLKHEQRHGQEGQSVTQHRHCLPGQENPCPQHDSEPKLALWR